MKKIFVLSLVLLFAAVLPACTSAGKSEKAVPEENQSSAPSLKGDWFAQIDIPQNNLVIILEFNFTSSTDCTVTCTWKGKSNGPVIKTGKAKYRLFEPDMLEIKFLNEDEWIRYDHVFDMENTYQYTIRDGKLVILPHRQFRGTEVVFGKGFDNRGYSEIIFD